MGTKVMPQDQRPSVVPLNIRDVFRTAHVQRWHVVNVHRRQTLAEHHYIVTMIAIYLAHELGFASRPSFLDFIYTCLEHDLAEVRIGDIPTPGKKFLAQFGHGVSQAEASLHEVPLFSDPLLEIDAALSRCIKLADLIESVVYIGENGYGRHAQTVAEVARRGLNDCVRECIQDWPEHGWFNVVNRVLSAAGALPLEPLYGE